MLNTAFIKRGKFVIEVSAKQHILNEVKESLFPYFEELPSFYSDAKWKVREYESTQNFSNSKIFYEKSVDSPEVKIYVDKDKKIITIKQEGEWLVLYLVRIVRSLFRWLYYEESAIFLHGAFISLHGIGIAILGEKRSGKTTTLLSLMSLEECKYITNDDLCVIQDKEIYKGLGWPRSLCIRKESLTVLKDLYNSEYVINSNHPGNINSRENKYIYVKPKELANNDLRRISAENRLNIILFTKFHDIEHPKIIKLGVSTASELLYENLQKYPETYCSFLGEYFTEPKLYKKEDMFKEILDGVDCFQLDQAFYNMKESKKIICELINRR